MLRSVTGANEVFFTARRSLPTRFGRNPASACATFERRSIMTRHRVARFFVLAVAALALAGCIVEPGYPRRAYVAAPPVVVGPPVVVYGGGYGWHHWR
jgi:hypothetical protein